jgi:hypothetical protein
MQTKQERQERKKKTKKEPKLKVRDLKASKDAKGGYDPTQAGKSPWVP